jgi:hypothetical protein
MQDELLNAAILLRRGSWVDPELFERAAKRMAELEKDTARIDALPKLADGFGQLTVSHTLRGVVFLYDFQDDCVAYGENIRAAIDAAIAESAK